MELLGRIRDLERESWHLWDEAVMNLAYSNLTEEQKQHYVETTYEATRKHMEAMQLLGLIEQMEAEFAA